MGNFQKYWLQNVGQDFIVLDFFVGGEDKKMTIPFSLFCSYTIPVNPPPFRRSLPRKSLISCMDWVSCAGDINLPHTPFPPPTGMHSDTLPWLWANQSLLLLLNTVCLAEKQQNVILLQWKPNWTSNFLYSKLLLLWYYFTKFLLYRHRNCAVILCCRSEFIVLVSL
jgi:hypothetical protein